MAPSQLTAGAISRLLSKGVYLPSEVPGNERVFLVAGGWKEAWTYRGCGQQAQVMVKFTADGMGGAYIRSEQTPVPPPRTLGSKWRWHGGVALAGTATGSAAANVGRQ